MSLSVDDHFKKTSVSCIDQIIIFSSFASSYFLAWAVQRPEAFLLFFSAKPMRLYAALGTPFGDQFFAPSSFSLSLFGVIHHSLSQLGEC